MCFRQYRRYRLRPLTRTMLVSAMLVALAACSGVPSYVIQPDDMAELMADIHTAEGVVDQNYYAFRTDSAKLALKMSVYRRHGVTPQEVDTSLVWYGHNLNKYNEVYDKAIEILERRIAEVRTTQAASAMAVAGDSVDLWNASRHLVIGSATPSEYLSFAIPSDENSEAGDVYSWRFRTLNNHDNLTMMLLVDYDDGTIEHSFNTAASDGWHSVTLVTDSTRSPRRVYGTTRLIKPLKGGYMYIDSISLTRSRKSAAAYSSRFRQRRYGEPRKPKVKNDSLRAEPTAMQVLPNQPKLIRPDGD